MTAIRSVEPKKPIGLRKIHRLNALFLCAFILLHLATHLSGFWGIDVYNFVQTELRRIYRLPPLELALLFSISMQILLGVKLTLDRLRTDGVSGFWRWLQVISGAVFFVFMVQHLFSLGMARLYFSLDTNFYWPASVMSGPWFIYYFTPYYFLGVFALFAHIGTGLRFVLIQRGCPGVARTTAAIFLILGSILGIAILPVIGGMLYPVELPSEWIDYLRFYDPDFTPRPLS